MQVTLTSRLLNGISDGQQCKVNVKSSNFSQGQIAQLRSFNQPARLFLIATILDGIVMSVWWLFFNFYILELGFDKEFLGLVTSSASLAALLLGIPLGLLSDRIGRKQAMILGVVIANIATALEVIIVDPTVILVASFIQGAGYTLFYLSQAPFMMKVSNDENRTLLFSLNFGLVTLSGAVGNLLAGQLPAFFGKLLSVPATSAEAYRAVLFFSVVLSSLTIVPLALIRLSRQEAQPAITPGLALPKAAPRSFLGTLTKPLTIKLSIPNLCIGLGAAILIPYMNVFYRERFGISDSTLGVLFSLSSVLTGIGAFIGPRLAANLGSKIRAVVLTQGLSLAFLLIVGFSPYLWLSSLGFLMRAALMNMAVPLLNAFAMEQLPEQEQGTVNSVKETAWQAGWTIGPYLSGVVQETYGFTPLFISTALLYGLATTLTWLFFHKQEKPAFSQPSLESVSEL